MTKTKGLNLYFILVLMASMLLVGAGTLGLYISESKLENLKQNDILLELRDKVSSGELEVDEGLGLVLVQGIEDAHVDAANLLDDVFIVGICIGLFLMLISIIFSLSAKSTVD
ncbi:hypothetical protein Q4520_21125 [Alteromonas sp. 1_MG-2023]|uniref:hypothetical protein n=1 Tax=Alteromonas sp. 1_MG-2023 TaxID=3062669 RepID=UPI0026E2AC4E|nr:hypothetical protein [Alteromonas sp. 1_MG-2023]MDO6477928.1 hypothetical protein [Alteromonas sp. 1_MG-2023]